MAARGDIRAGRAFVELYIRNSGLVKGLQNASQRLKNFGGNVMAVGGMMTALGASIIAPLAGAVLHFANLGSELADVSARTGVATSSLAEFKFAAEQTGATLGDVEKAVMKMQKAGLGNDFAKMAEEIAAIEDPSERAQRAMEVWGKSGTKLLPMIENLQALRAEAQRRGLVPSDEAVASADRIGDALDTIKSIAGAAAFEVGAALAPMLEPWLETISGVLTWTVKWVKENGALFRTIAMVGAGIMAAGVILTGFGAAVFALGMTLGAAATVLTAIGGAITFLLNPVVLVTASLAAGVFAWAKWTRSGQAAVRNLMAFFGPLLQTARDTFAGVVDAVMAGDLELAGKIALAGLKLVFAQGLSQIAAMIGGTFGDALGTIGSQILGGDFAGAWETAVMGMASIWDSFVSGIVNAFTKAASAVVGVWSKSVQRISAAIIQFDPTGTFAKQHETKRQQEAARIPVLERERNELLADMEKVKGGASVDSLGRGGVNTVADLESRIADNQAAIDAARLAMGQTLDEFKAGSQEAATAYVSDIEGGLKGTLETWRKDRAKQAEESKREFGSRVAGGTGEVTGEIGRLQQELADLRNRAASARAASKFAAPDAAGLPTEETASKAAAFVAFGGAALAGQSTGGVQERMARTLDNLLAESKRLLTQSQKNHDATMKMVTTP